MKVYQSNEIKNISLLGSSGAGKTTLVEAMLYESGVIKRRGSVAAKNTVSDYFPVEKEYGYSVFSTVAQVEWLGKKLNFIDCPGSDDFIGGVVTSLNVTDTALILLNTQYGVEVGTDNHFRYTEKLNKPMDTEHLVHRIENVSQTRKGVFDRYLNMQDVFAVDDPQAFADKHVLLVDDVVTTGSTLEACIQALLQSPGVKASVFALSMAH